MPSLIEVLRSQCERCQHRHEEQIAGFVRPLMTCQLDREMADNHSGRLVMLIAGQWVTCPDRLPVAEA